MPDTRILVLTKYTKEVTKSVASFFVAICGLDGLGSNIAISLACAGIGKLLLLKIRKTILFCHGKDVYVGQRGTHKMYAQPLRHKHLTFIKTKKDRLYEKIEKSALDIY